MKTYRLILYGNVQGVGMRFFIHRTAKHFAIKGMVKNLNNGTVEAIVQGKEVVIKQFLEYVKAKSPGYIEKVDKKLVETSTQYTKFTIKLF